MIRRLGWAGFWVVAIVLLGSGLTGGIPIGGSPNGSIATTYTVSFFAIGLPHHFKIAMTFNGVRQNTSNSIWKFTSVAAGYNSWNLSYVNVDPLHYGVAYVPTVVYGYMDVPNQLYQWVDFQTEYLVHFNATLPSDVQVTPSGPTYFPARSNVTLLAQPYLGYRQNSFKWTGAGAALLAAIGDSEDFSLGGPANFTSVDAAIPYHVGLNETGLPSGTSWTVTLGGTNYVVKTASFSTTSFTGSSSFSISNVVPATAVTYVPTPTYGYLDPPYLTSVSIHFVKEDQVNFTASPVGGGSVQPSYNILEPDGGPFQIAAAGTSTTVFSSWYGQGWGGSASPVAFTSTTKEATTAVVSAPADIQANFTAGTPCSTRCQVTFNEVGIPANGVGKTAVPWAVTFNGSTLGSTSRSIVFAGPINASSVSGSWSVPSPISTGTPGLYYVATPAYGYLSLPDQTTAVVQFVEEALVNFAANPAYTGSSVYPNVGYYPLGSVATVYAAQSSTYRFAGWSSSSPRALPIGSPHSASTNFTVRGPGWINATFVQPDYNVTFLELGIKKGTVWGIQFGGTTYFGTAGGSNLNDTIVIPSVTPGYYTWYAVSPLYPHVTSTGIQDVPVAGGYASLLVYGNVGEVVPFVVQYLVAVKATGTSGGSTNPYGSAFYTAGTVLALSAINGSGVNFTGWNNSNPAVYLASTSEASTFVVVTAPTTIRARFS